MPPAKPPPLASIAQFPHEPRAAEAVRQAMLVHDRRLRRYLSQLLGAAETDDAAQEVYARLLHAARTGGHTEFGLPYIKRTAENVARDILRRRRARFAGAHDEIDDAVSAADPSPFDAVRDRQGLELVREAVMSLAPLQRRILLMHRLDDMSLAEVAAELRVPLRTVQRHMRAGLGACRAKLLDLGWFEKE